MKQPFDDLIKFRAPSSLVERLEVIAKKTRRQKPDLYRIALEDYADAAEKDLGITPLKEQPAPYRAKVTASAGKPLSKPSKKIA